MKKMPILKKKVNPTKGMGETTMLGKETTVLDKERKISSKETIMVSKETTQIGKETTMLGRIGAVWTTRQMAGDKSREVEVQITIGESLKYFMFLGLLLILSVGMTGTTMFLHTKVMINLFVEKEYVLGGGTNFKSSSQIKDFWDFAENSMISGLYWDTWYGLQTPDKEQIENNETSINHPVPVAKVDRKIMYHNELLGLPRLRQVRVRPTSCIVHEMFRKSIKKCYDFYSSSGEDQTAFGKGDAWTYKTEEELEGSSYSGVLSRYGGGGFVQNLSGNKNETIEILRHLKKNLWLDRGTSVLFFDFTVYNANINLFCIVRMVMEFPPTGGVIPSYSFRSLKLLRYFKPVDFFILSCEMLFICFTLFYTLEEGREIVYYKMAYFKNKWNCLDTFILIISYICIGLSTYEQVEVNSRLTNLLKDDQHHEDFSSLGYWRVQYTNWAAICVFFSWIKIFKYISFNKTMSQLSSTLSRCARDVAGFAVMFFIVFSAFAQLGYLLFGRQVEAFSSFSRAVFTQLRTILGDFDYVAIERANRILGPIFFLMYIFFVFFILLNMFLAIINDTYSEVKTEIAVKRNKFDIIDFFKRGVTNVKTSMGIKEKEKEKVILKEDGSVLIDDIREVLRKCNFLEVEIEMFLTKCNLKDGNKLSAEEVRRVMRNYGMIDDEATKLGRKISDGNPLSKVYVKDCIALDRRLQRLQKLLQAAVDRCNIIADILEHKLYVQSLTKIDRTRF